MRSSEQSVAAVLGYGLKDDGTLPEVSRLRVQAATEMFHFGLVQSIILSGGRSFYAKPGTTEASAMARLARALGVPNPDLVLEEQSDDTWTNARCVRALLPPGWKQLVVITSETQFQRAVKAFTWVFRQEMGNVSFHVVCEWPHIPREDYRFLQWSNRIKYLLMLNLWEYRVVKWLLIQMRKL